MILAGKGEYESIHIPRGPDEEIGESTEPKYPSKPLYGGREVERHRGHHKHHNKQGVQKVESTIVKAKVDPDHHGGQKETLDYSSDQVSKNKHHTTHKEGHVDIPQNQPAPAAMHLREHEKRSSASMADVYFLGR